MIPKKILYCTDFSENSGPAGQCAAEYAALFEADVVIFHVIDCWAGFPGDPKDALLEVRKLEDSARNRLEQLATEFQQDNGRVETNFVIGIPAEEIVKLADKESVDLIIMGTHGWGGVRHILLGSVAERVLRTANCQVLVVRPSRDGGLGQTISRILGF